MKYTIQTYTGKEFNLEFPKPEMVDIVDIAWALSNTCRYCGHTSIFYSVAEHSVRMAEELEFFPTDKLSLLLHDSAEAYIGDITGPVKLLLPDIKRVEDRILATIQKALGWEMKEYPSVKKADNCLLATEIRDIMGGQRIPSWGDWLDYVEPLPKKIRPWPQDLAFREFLSSYNSLRGKI